MTSMNGSNNLPLSWNFAPRHQIPIKTAIPETNLDWRTSLEKSLSKYYDVYFTATRKRIYTSHLGLTKKKDFNQIRYHIISPN